MTASEERGKRLHLRKSSAADIANDCVIYHMNEKHCSSSSLNRRIAVVDVTPLSISEPNRRNLFVYYLPITERWRSKVMSDSKSERGSKLQMRDEYYMPLYIQRKDENSPRLSHSEFWKQRGGLTSYSDLQEVFYMQVSKRYGAKRGESYSLIKNTNPRQQERFDRQDGDLYDELYFDDSPY